jgi:hypothetical protein
MLADDDGQGRSIITRKEGEPDHFVTPQPCSIYNVLIMYGRYDYHDRCKDAIKGD